MTEDQTTESQDIRVYVDELGPHILEIITHSEWLSLTPDEGAEQFLAARLPGYGEDIHVRFSPEGGADGEGDADGD